MTSIEEDYLDKDFDYTKLTMVKLKKILFENGVLDIPSNIKKQQLLEIYKVNIHDKIPEILKKKSKDKNKYQSDRSSIIDLQPNDKDQHGGVFTNGRTRRVSSGIEDRLEVIKNGPLRRGSLNKEDYKEDPKIRPKRPQSASPVKNPLQNTSFLDSIGTYLKNSTSRGSPAKEDTQKTSPAKKEIQKNSLAKKEIQKTSLTQKTSPAKKTPPAKKEDKKKIYLDVDTSDFSNTSFFSYKTNKEATPIKNQRPAAVKKTFSLIFPIAGVFILVVSYVLLKGLPYCAGGEFCCINVPENGKIVEGRLVCNKGFLLKTSLFRDTCVKDDTKEAQMLRTIKSIVKKLEIMRGYYVYGFAKDFKMNLEDLTTDNDLVQVLRHTPGIIIKDGVIYSSNYRTTLRVFFKFYSTKAFYLLIPLLLLLSFAFFFRRHRLATTERQASSRKITKEILNILLRQLIISTKNMRFPSYVYVDQLRDVFVVEDKVWALVRKNLESNSNVRKDVIEKKEVWEWIGPLIHSTDNFESLLA